MNQSFVRRLAAALLLVSLQFAGVRAQQPGASAPSADRLKQIVTYRASDPLEGRRTGTAGATEAANFIAGEFKRLGLPPGIATRTANAGGTSTSPYLQSFPYVS